MGIFLFSRSVKRYMKALPLTKQAISQEMRCLIYLWVSSGVFRRVGITGISLQPTVFRLHVALIDFSPSLLKCTINQYSNKSSFILEKCCFQLSGHGVLWCQCGRKRGDGLHLALGLHPDTTTHTYSINIKCKHNYEQRHITCMVSRSLYGCFFCNQGFQHWTSLMSLLCFLLYTHNDNFIVHKANLLERKQWFIRCCVLTRPHI